MPAGVAPVKRCSYPWRALAPPQNHKGRSMRHPKIPEQHKPFLHIENRLMDSIWWANLRPEEQALYLSVRYQPYDKRRRGSINSFQRIPFSYRDYAGTISKRAFHRWMKGLVEKNVLKIVEKGGFPNKRTVYAIPHLKGFLP